MKIETFWDINALSQIKTKNEAAAAFEAEFLHIFLKEVRKSMHQGGFLGKSFASKMYLDMFDMQLAKSLSQSDQIGLKEYISNAIETYRKNSHE